MLKDRVALVTGSGSGIGRSMVIAFAQEHASVVIADRNEANAGEVARFIKEKFNVPAMAIKADVTDVDDVEAMVNRTLGEFGKLDILVNNAGVGQEVVPTIKQSVEKWDKIMAVHLRGTFLCSRRVGQWMIERNTGGCILNVASVVGFGGFPMRTAYGPAKAAIMNLTQALAVEWASCNIRVNCIAPGYIVTPLVERGMEHGLINMDAIKNRTPMKRLGLPEEIADAAVFLVSDKAAFITGVTLPVDGGWLANRYV